jgi:UDP-2-acetamido-2,6-beta-L-arabino-hexul-4-ose reductase
LSWIDRFDRRVLVTGADGFIGRNFSVRLAEFPNVAVTKFVRHDDPAILSQLVAHVDAVVHLAGENRPEDEAAFAHVNADLTAHLCSAVEGEFKTNKRRIPLILTSSIHAEHDSPYGRSKLAAENTVKALSKATENQCVILRLPGVFGKWCKPNYNSVVATFCHNIARDLPIQINDPATDLRLVYVDDVVTALLAALDTPEPGCTLVQVEPEYTTTLGELANQIRAFGDCRSTLMIERVGTGFVRALYATYLSYLPKEKFSYQITQHADPRGVFVEMLKTSDSGQFSYFTAPPGITRGGHYHHTKTEKFFVVKGKALFRFRHLLTNELVEFRISGSISQVVDTIPGWSHDITNVGDDELVVMLWASENFAREKPDTVASDV